MTPLPTLPQPRHLDPGVLAGERVMVMSDRSGVPLQHQSGPAQDIVVSRWLDDSAVFRRQAIVSPPDCHVITIALRATRIGIARGTATLFEGAMPAGMVHVTGPGQTLSVELRAACDFIQLRVNNDVLHRCRSAGTECGCPGEPAFGDFITHDVLCEQLARSLLQNGSLAQLDYAESVGRTIVMRLAALPRCQTRVASLPKWRLKRVLEYVHRNIDEPLTLAGLSQVAGLSRMHFAAQFRTATGFSPHSYILHTRIEHAKAALANSNMKLAEVALSTGFQSQAHFTTVFKRVAGETPGAWRRANAGPVALAA